MALFLTRPAREGHKKRDESDDRTFWEAPFSFLPAGEKLTFNLGNTSQQDVPLQLLVANLLLDVGQDGLDQFALLGFAHLSFVTHVRVEHGFDVGCERGLLLERERLVFEFGGLLRVESERGASVRERDDDGRRRRRRRLTLDSSNSDFVRPSTSFISPTDSIRPLTASV